MRFNLLNLTYADVKWSLTLLGAAIGMGLLFLPIQAGVMGIWIMLITTIITIPAMYVIHKMIARFIISNECCEDATIIDTVDAHLGKVMRDIFTILYAIAIIPTIMIYAGQITSAMQDFIVYQLGLPPVSRFILAGILILILTLATTLKKSILVNLSSSIVYPLIFIILGISIYMISRWNTSTLYSIKITQIPRGIWSSLPMFFFSFTFISFLSQFTISQRRKYGIAAKVVSKKTDSIILLTIILISVIALFFTYSVVLGLTPQELNTAKGQNINILSYLADTIHAPILSYLGPLVVLAAIATSYFGVFQGAREGVTGIINQYTPLKNEKITFRFSTIILFLFAWFCGVYNPSVVDIVGLFSGPSFVLFAIIIPLYAMWRVKAFRALRLSWPAIILIICSGLLLLAFVIQQIILSPIF